MGVVIYFIIGALVFFGSLTTMITMDKLRGKTPDFEEITSVSAMLGFLWGVALPCGILFGLAYGIYRVLRMAGEHVSDRIVAVVETYQKKEIL